MLHLKKNIFLVGIKGVAMTNLAVILKKMGKNVSGSDIKETFITDNLLKKNHISWVESFHPEKIPLSTDLVVYSAAHQGINNPQVKEAVAKKIDIASQAQLLGWLTEQFKTKIAVCGCHGKTTTSSLLAYALKKMGVNPSYLVGAPYFNNYPGGSFDSKEYFIIEADEYGINPPLDTRPKFHLLNPDYIICTNIDFDHPDVYENLHQVKRSFLKFFQKVKHSPSLRSGLLPKQGSDVRNPEPKAIHPTGLHPWLSSSWVKTEKKLLFCADDRNLMDVAKTISKEAYLTYGFDKEADLQITNLKTTEAYSSFELICSQGLSPGLNSESNLGRFFLPLFGKKQVSNTAGVICLLLQLGFPTNKIRQAIKNFHGAKRRFELIYSKNKTCLFDDYAHHPKEIEATITAARTRFPDKRIIVIFQPHTYSRTATLLKDFSRSLNLADKVFILPIFASARENPKNFKVNSADIAQINPKKITNITSKQQLLLDLKSSILNDDIIFTMGAGDVYKLKGDIIEVIKQVA